MLTKFAGRRAIAIPALIAFWSFALSCSSTMSPKLGRTPSQEMEPAQSLSSPAAEDQEKTEPLLDAPRELAELEVPDYSPASMAVPGVAAQEGGYRVFIVAHGAGGRAKDHCEFWDLLLPKDVWIVCLAGTPLDRRDPDGGAFFENHRKLRSELAATVSALEEREGSKLQARGWGFLGYSQGATMGALALVTLKKGEGIEAASLFASLILIEGGGENWTLSRAREFLGQGGRKVLFACGTKGCAHNARRSNQVLRKAGVESAFVEAQGAGHSYWGEVAEVLKPELESFFSEP